MKKLGFWLILLVFLYGFMESTAWVAYRILFGENFSFSGIAEKQEKLLSALNVEAKQSGKLPLFLLHPYYGYIANPNWAEEYRRQHGTNYAGQFTVDDSTNAYGFFGDSSPIQPRDPARLVVAVTGGSVAAFAGSWGRDTFVEGLSRIPAFKGRKIVLLDMAMAAYKQPQQLMVVGDILSQGGHIDLLINLDGFNEIALPQGHDAFGSGVSPFFPQDWKQISETRFSRDSMERLGKIALIQERRLQWASYASGNPLSYNVTAGTAWWFADNYLARQKSALEQDLGRGTEGNASGVLPTTADLRTSLGPRVDFKDERALYEASASLWARSSVLLNNMVASQGGVYVHFLQPNQYFPGSKPMGSAEAKAALSSASAYKPEVERGYPYLRSAGQALAQSSGIRFFDLSALFKDDPAPVYADNCCHFTKEGNAKLVQAIISRIADSMRKDAAPHAASIVEFDYRPKTLRAFALQPGVYVDGSGVELKRAASMSANQLPAIIQP
jgi:hypothetical protein